MPSSRVLPQNCLRASSQPSAMPNGSAQTVATIEMRRDSSTAVHSSGVRPSTMVLTVPADLAGYFTRTGKPYDSKIVLADAERRNARYGVASGLALTVAATG